MKVLLDTNAYSDFRRAGKWKKHITEASEVFLPVFVLAELRAGFLLGKYHQRNEIALLQFLEAPVVSLLAPTSKTASLYAEFFKNLRNAGTPIPTHDIWIAALAFENEAVLLSADNHFQHLPQIAWASG